MATIDVVTGDSIHLKCRGESFETPPLTLETVRIAKRIARGFAEAKETIDEDPTAIMLTALIVEGGHAKAPKTPAGWPKVVSEVARRFSLADMVRAGDAIQASIPEEDRDALVKAMSQMTAATP